MSLFDTYLALLVFYIIIETLEVNGCGCVKFSALFVVLKT